MKAPRTVLLTGRVASGLRIAYSGISIEDGPASHIGSEPAWVYGNRIHPFSPGHSPVHSLVHGAGWNGAEEDGVLVKPKSGEEILLDFCQNRSPVYVDQA